MAIDNLNYYSSWLPAWQQTDKYSSQPWCLKSKNLDIFSSSKSVKATAFSTPTTWDADVIKEEWGLVLKTDWKVYEREDGVDTLFVDPSANFPVYKISYNWRYWTYNDAQRWTVQDMAVMADENGWQSFVVYTDRASYTYSKAWFIIDKYINSYSSNLTNQWWPFTDGYGFTKNSSSWSTSNINIKVRNTHMAKLPLRIKTEERSWSDTHMSIQSWAIMRSKYYYDPELDSMVYQFQGWEQQEIPATDLTEWVTLYVDSQPWYEDYWVDITFKYTRNEWVTSWYAWNWDLYVGFNNLEDGLWRVPWTQYDTNYFYSYLPIRERKLSPVWEYYWMKGTSFQPLYSWEYEWATNSTWEKIPRYDLVAEYWWENNINMDIVWIISWNDSFYMIGNMDWNWYIIPCDLSWGRGTPYIAYWCTFKWVENIDYLLYLVWEDRGISTLWVFNQQELVPILWWKHEINKNDIIWVDEEYKFDWKIVNWRKNLILATTDNRIFQYWQTYGGKGWAFIYQVPANATITALKANWSDLEIDYSITVNDTTTNYAVKYQDDTPMKNYNTEWEAVYPIVLGNHLLEKEETDLYASFILPSSTTKLEFWGMANHYHFRTFTSEDNATLSETESYKIKWTSWNYALKFIERNNNQYTFRLEGDLPLQTTSEMQIIDSNSAVVINYTEFNHFRKIWTIETDKYLEWDFRFTNLNNKLELPKSHSLQIMVKWKWTANYTPELFSVDLVANQRERW